MVDKKYIESILIHDDNGPATDTPMFNDEDCDELFEFEGVLKLADKK